MILRGSEVWANHNPTVQVGFSINLAKNVVIYFGKSRLMVLITCIVQKSALVIFSTLSHFHHSELNNFINFITLNEAVLILATELYRNLNMWKSLKIIYIKNKGALMFTVYNKSCLLSYCRSFQTTVTK